MSKFLMHNVENSLRAAITHMEACDGLPFRVFIKSPDIRKGLVAQGFSPLPKSNETKENGDRAWQNRMLLCWEMEQLKKMGTRFSITFDEWTSTRNRRYMNVMFMLEDTVLEPRFASCAQNYAGKQMCSATRKQASSIRSVSEGRHRGNMYGWANVMKKVGTLIDAEQQLCYAHEIQLTFLTYSTNKVTKVYPNKKWKTAILSRSSDVHHRKRRSASKICRGKSWAWIDPIFWL